MKKGKRSEALDVKRKNRRKWIKTWIQLFLVIMVIFLIYQAVARTDRYAEPDKSTWHNRSGFVALSYFGVSRTGTPLLIDKAQLKAQLQTLHDQGYVTVSQQDILDFYQKGKALPDKALFLSFEDGRNDSSLYAQPLLERYNDKATFLTYANKMGNGDHKFVQPKELRSMMKSGYWEMGTNGYRLTYINIFDKNGGYIGVKDENKLDSKEDIEHYNHYLMDFIRDENMIPLEDRDTMQVRISKDYQLMDTVYTDKLGFVPGVYMIMHANAMYGSMNPLVTDVNDRNIRSLFQMHFNLEGNAFNGPSQDLYNLTRIQPEPYWSTNHLLMKIGKDSGQQMTYVTGDQKQSGQWKQAGGAAEFKDNRIVLTSPPAGEGKLLLDQGEQAPEDFTLNAKVSGNVVGKQSFYLKDRGDGQQYVRITLDRNEIQVEQKLSGSSVTVLGTQKLDPVNWSSEDLAFDKATVYSAEEAQAGANTDDEDVYPVNIKNTRQIEMKVSGNRLEVIVDRKSVLQTSIDPSLKGGAVGLGSAYSPQNTKDDIYDGIFEDVTVTTENAADGKTSVWYTNKLLGWKKVAAQVEHAMDATIDWAIDTF
ncbi:polysaccharide deacetylase family protein [Paenibacillus sp. PSB04]|uniref:polysaccharide deacetylase family protein n=1 Tax=Paenibacillus sp. PSB04 TaxID=2866810 RepID=UPI0021F0B619|nr:polysaccharide deacetylase family protein [Paenibacillus sp. PSB04]UYO03138.1 polysaccharide deacetylase family protein [Paenibacillus sp. PSB04]